jgi:hypothetical protein
VQDHGYAELSAEARQPKFEQCVTRRREQRAENLARIASPQHAKLGRQGENNVEVSHWQKPLRARSDPFLLPQRLTLGTVPVAAGVVGGTLEPARAADVDVTTEFRSSAQHHRRKHPSLSEFQVHLGFQLGTVLLHDVGDVETWPPGRCQAVPHRWVSPSSSALADFWFSRSAALTRAHSVWWF